MTRQNWYWDINLPEAKIKEILTREDDPRFPRIAGALVSRVEDPKDVFKLIAPLAFCRRWRAIDREIKSDEWTKEKAAFWKSTYIKLSKELRNKGEKIRRSEKIALDDLTRALIAKLRETRKKALMSQKELAELMGYSQQYISGIERGREKIGLEFLKKFCSITNEPLENFPLKLVMAEPVVRPASDLRQKKIYENLLLFGPGPAAFYKTACDLMSQTTLEAQTHVVSHCLREIESAIRKVLIKTREGEGNQKQDSENQKEEILAVLQFLNIPLDSPIARTWMSLAGRSNDDALHRRAHREALGPPRPGDDAFINWWNNVEDMLDSVLAGFRYKFLGQFKAIDDLLSKSHPNQTDVKILKEEIANNRVTLGYFFNKCQNPEWLGLLKQGGLFKAPPSSEFNQEDKTIRIPPWPQSAYLARMAALRPKEVSEIMREIPETDNGTIHENLVDAALAMPAEYSVQWVEQEIDWISKQSYLGLLLPEKLGLLTAHLAKGGQREAALKLAGVLLKIFPDLKRTPDTKEFSLPPEPKAFFDAWHYERVVEENIPDLVRGVGIPALDLLCGLLRDAIQFSRRAEAGGPEDHSYVWRESIEHGGRGHSRGFENVLVSGIRDAAKLLVETGISKTDEIVQFLEQQPWKVFRRIALHLLALFPDRASDLVAARLTNYSLFDDHAVRHEYARLLDKCFGMLSVGQKEIILSWIEKGPDLEQFQQSQERFSGKRPSDDEAKQYSKYWQRDRLAWFKSQLPENWRNRYDSLVVELGEPEHPDLPFHMGVGWTGPTSPKSADELSRMSIPELVEYLRTWKSEKGWMAPSPEGLGRVLSDVVKGEPERFSREALTFKVVHPIYIRSFISGIIDVLKEKRKVEWAPIFELCKWVMDQRLDISDPLSEASEDSNPDRSGLRSAIARLISEVLQGDKTSFEQRKIIWEVLAPLTVDLDPTPEHEAKYGGSNMGPATLAINTTRGEAMHAVVRYALWVRRYLEQSPEAKEKLSRGFDEMPEVKNVLEVHLDTKKDPSLAVRSVYGQWLPWLVLIDSKWVRDHLEAIFPSQKSMRRYYDAAWETYVVFCHAYDNVFPILRKQYENAVKSLRTDQNDKNEDGDPKSHLVEHIMVLYWRGLFRLDDHGSIFSQFWELAPDKSRAYAHEFIGRSLYDTKDKVPPAILQRLRALWESRLSSAQSETGVIARGELGAFGWWFASGKFDDEWAIAQLYEAIKIAGSVDPDHWVVERLAKLVVQMPEECVKCLELIVLHDSTGWGIYSWREAAKEILGKALQTEASAHAEKVINYLGSKGHLEFGELLQKV